MGSLQDIKEDLQNAVTPGKAKDLMRFIKTGPGLLR